MENIRYIPKAASRRPRTKPGSALILAVVLTSILAIIGVMFMMVARVDRMATSGISDNKGLDSAIEAILAKISQELALDVPGAANAEYYDYPGSRDDWLACLEPYDAGNPRWRQISDLYGKFPTSGLQAEIIEDYQKPSDVDDSNSSYNYPADADGDGVADSKWIELDGITSSKGKPIYAAIRIIDNGAMLNINTAREFDPNSSALDEIDGSSQLQIDLFTLAQRSPSNTIGQLDTERFGLEPHNLNNYLRDVVWRYNQPDGNYMPFDISDELELRNRYFIKQVDTQTRAKNFWRDVFKVVGEYTPFDSSNFSQWDENVVYDDVNTYDYRHIGTIYNMDRIINPYGGKMLNINTADANSIRARIESTLDPNYPNADAVAAQIAVNLIDFRDNDPNISVLDVNGVKYYGFERPLIYISEVVHRFEASAVPGEPDINALAIELYKSDSVDDDPCNWRLLISTPPPGSSLPPPGIPLPPNPNVPYNINWSGNRQLYAILKDPGGILPPIGPNTAVQISFNLAFEADSTIELQRRIDEVNDIWLTVDEIELPNWLFPGPPYYGAYSFKRDITRHKCIRRLWDVGNTMGNILSLGSAVPYYIDPSTTAFQVYPENRLFKNVGELGMLLRKGVYPKSPYPIGTSDNESDVRIDLADPNFQNLFRYLTVFDPARDGINNDGDYIGNFENVDEDALNETPEWKVPGRININTAPWYVLAQLPWVSQREGGYNDASLARAMVAYRDKTSIGSDPNYNSRPGWSGFRSIGELNRVVDGSNDYRIDYYSLDPNDMDDFPDLTPNDGARNDFEERDVIFARISNLVTVRSDVFTAYILVRVGKDGPQKRVIVIFDRSNVYSAGDRVRIIALHPVPDPR